MCIRTHPNAIKAHTPTATPHKLGVYVHSKHVIPKSAAAHTTKGVFIDHHMSLMLLDLRRQCCA